MYYPHESDLKFKDLGVKISYRGGMLLLLELL